MGIRTSVLTALRTRLLTVSGVCTTWPVIAPNRKLPSEDEPTADATFIEDIAVGDSTSPEAFSGPNVHWRLTTGVWQLNVCFPPNTGLSAALAIVDAIEVALVTTPITLASGEYVRIIEVVAQPPRLPDDDPHARIPLVVTYQFTAHT